MNIVANISFYINFKRIKNGHVVKLHSLPFILTNKGLKCVWIEINNAEMARLKVKPTYNLYISKEDFLIKDNGWFAKELGKIRIPFKEEHLNVANLC